MTQVQKYSRKKERKKEKKTKPQISNYYLPTTLSISNLVRYRIILKNRNIICIQYIMNKQIY